MGVRWNKQIKIFAIYTYCSENLKQWNTQDIILNNLTNPNNWKDMETLQYSVSGNEFKSPQPVMARVMLSKFEETIISRRLIDIWIQERPLQESGIKKPKRV